MAASPQLEVLPQVLTVLTKSLAQTNIMSDDDIGFTDAELAGSCHQAVSLEGCTTGHNPRCWSRVGGYLTPRAAPTNHLASGLVRHRCRDERL